MKFSVQRALFRAPKRFRWGATRCYWCGTSVTYNGRNQPQHASREHLLPKSLGGGFGHNIVVACRRCNSLRGNDTSWVPFHKLPVELRHRGTLPPVIALVK